MIELSRKENVLLKNSNPAISLPSLTLGKWKEDFLPSETSKIQFIALDFFKVHFFLVFSVIIYFCNVFEFWNSAEFTEFLFWYDFELTSWDASQYINLIVNKRFRIQIFWLFYISTIARFDVWEFWVKEFKVQCVPTSFDEKF